jgi:hypothetical protein
MYELYGVGPINEGNGSSKWLLLEPKCFEINLEVLGKCSVLSLIW